MKMANDPACLNGTEDFVSSIPELPEWLNPGMPKHFVFDNSRTLRSWLPVDWRLAGRAAQEFRDATQSKRKSKRP
jgi:hypothetical protein